MTELFVSGLISFAAVAVLLPVLCRVAVSEGFVDHPGGRKDHEDTVPPVGGLAVFPVFAVLCLAFGMDFSAAWPVMTALGLVLIVGALDDYLDIRASLKFFVQFVAALIVVVPGGTAVESLGDFIGTGELVLGWFSVPFTVFCVMLLMNAVNMMDGLDGLAGGQGVVSLSCLVAAALLSGSGGEQTTYMALLTGALAGFLVFNMRSPFNRRAKVFLGDSGSMALGLMLAWFCIRLAQPPHQVLAPISVAWVVAVPVMDAFALFVIRIFSGRHPFSADRLHFHHHFINAGISPGRATAIILAVAALLGGAGIAGIYAGIPGYIMTLTWSVLLMLHTLLTIKSAHFISFLKKLAARG